MPESKEESRVPESEVEFRMPEIRVPESEEEFGVSESEAWNRVCLQCRGLCMTTV